MGKLTDGIICTDGENGNVRCWKGSTVEIKIDLEGYFEIKAFKADLFGNLSWGIPDPANAKINIYVSNDGKNFELLGEAKPGEKSDEGFKRIEFTLVPDKKVCAKAVIFEYNIDGNFCWTSECTAFGLKAEEEKPEESKPEESKPEETGEKPSEDKKTDVGIIALIAGAVVVAVVAILTVKSKKNKGSKKK